MEALSPHLSACSLPGGGRVFATSLLWSRARLLLVSGQSLGLRILIYSFFLEEVSEQERDGENGGFLQSVNLKNVFFL